LYLANLYIAFPQLLVLKTFDSIISEIQLSHFFGFHGLSSDILKYLYFLSLDVE